MNVPFARLAVAFVVRGVQEEISYRFSSLLHVLGVLFSLFVFYEISRLFPPKVVSSYLRPYGGNYFAFVVLGVALNDYSGVGLSYLSGTMRRWQTEGPLEAVLASPVSLHSMAWLITLEGTIWSSVRVALYLAVGLIAVPAFFSLAHPWALLVALGLSLAAFSGLGLLSASFILAFKRGNPVIWLVGGLSTLLSGVYYPVDLLPRYLQAAADVFPLTHSLQALRLILLQNAGFGRIWPSLVALLAFDVLLLASGHIGLSLALEYVRKHGSLSEY